MGGGGTPALIGAGRDARWPFGWRTTAGGSDGWRRAGPRAGAWSGPKEGSRGRRPRGRGAAPARADPVGAPDGGDERVRPMGGGAAAGRRTLAPLARQAAARTPRSDPTRPPSRPRGRARVAGTRARSAPRRVHAGRPRVRRGLRVGSRGTCVRTLGSPPDGTHSNMPTRRADRPRFGFAEPIAGASRATHHACACSEATRARPLAPWPS